VVGGPQGLFLSRYEKLMQRAIIDHQNGEGYAFQKVALDLTHPYTRQM